MEPKTVALQSVYQDILELGHPRPMAYFIKGDLFFREYPTDLLSRQKEWLKCFGEGAKTHGATRVLLFMAGKFYDADLPKPVPIDDERKAISIFDFDLSETPRMIKASFSYIEYKKPGKVIKAYPERHLDMGQDDFYTWFSEGYANALKGSGGT